MIDDIKDSPLPTEVVTYGGLNRNLSALVEMLRPTIEAATFSRRTALCVAFLLDRLGVEEREIEAFRLAAVARIKDAG